MSELKVYAVAGRPVLHSLSPGLFNPWFRAAGLNAVYTRLAANSAEDAIRTARAMKLAGLNVTSPFKEDIMGFLDGVDAAAAKIGAVNCVVARNGRLRGFNTDWIGAVRALIRNGADPRGKRIAVLGAGGAARAAAYGLIKRGAARVTILNRTEERARDAARALECDAAVIGRAGAIIRKSDILVSCVSSRAFPLDACLPSGKPVVLRADYRDSSPAAGRSRHSARPIDGREWLIEQAIPAFRLFTGRAIPARLAKAARAAVFDAEPDEKSNVALVGFMGSGKTATGRALARALGWGFVDTDAEIEARAGMPIPKIFATRGEPVFRGLEKSLIAGLVPAAKKDVFSFGGGAVLDRDTRALIARRCRVIWLWTSLETALARIDSTSRPVLRAADGERAIKRAYRSRFRASARVADLILSTDGPSPDEAAERTRYEMDQAFED
jgi:shikimate dehydrogenase